MHDAAVTALVAAGAFFGTMIDNLVALTAQLSLTDAARVRRACVGQLTGVIVVMAITAIVATAITTVPVRWVGVLAVAPVVLAYHAFRHRHDPSHARRRGAVTTFLMTLALGGDNLAVWIPLWRVFGMVRDLETAGVFLVGDVLLLGVARAISTHPRVAAATRRRAPALSPVLFLALAIVVLWQCRWF